MKKVFSKEIWVKDRLNDIYQIINDIYQKMNDNQSWINQCDGLTAEEMNELGYSTYDGWMVEVKEK